MFLPEIQERFRGIGRRRDGLLRAVYSVADDAWDEKSAAAPDWTHKDILAHVAANDERPHVRLRAVLGDPDDAALGAINRTDEWNQERVDARRDRSVAELVSELDANRAQTIELLSRLKAEHLDSKITRANGQTYSLPEYIDCIGEHESTHAGQLVPASRARRAK